MFAKLEIFRVSQAMAVHAGARQTVIAGNIANADTPGYRARDLRPFAEMLAPDRSAFRATRPGHLGGADISAVSLRAAERTGAGVEADPNGNTVALETEMAHAVDVQRQHDRALAIYKSALNILRSGIGRK